MDERSLRELLAPLRSGDVLAGIAAENEEERIRAQMALADVPLKRFLSECVVPYETDEITRLILDSHDARAFAPVSSFTVGQLRDWLLTPAADTEALTALAPGLTPEMVAAASKLMRIQDLVLVASKCGVVTRFRDTIGLPGRFSSRLQPNHPTDDARGVLASIIDGLQYGSGDAVIGIVEERVVRDEEAVLLRLLDDGVTPLADVERARQVHLGADVIVLHGGLGQRAQRIQPRDAVGGLLDAVNICCDHVAYLAEVAVFEVVYPVLRCQERVFKLLQLLGEIALVRDKRLLAYVVGGDVFKPRGFRHVNIVAEHLVVADLELLYARALALTLLQLRDHLGAVVADVAQLIDLFGVALAQYPTLADGKRRLIDERLADGYYYSKSIRLLKHLLEHPELLDRPISEEVDY